LIQTIREALNVAYPMLGLVCYPPAIREPGQLRLRLLRGLIFKNWAVSEIYQAQARMLCWRHIPHFSTVDG
jgi:hypothetical protein